MRSLRQGTCSDSESWSLGTNDDESAGQDDQHCGNLMGKKSEDVVRLAFFNVGTFPAFASDPRNGTVWATFKKVAGGCMGMGRIECQLVISKTK
jgi:hypothetical protein